MLPSVWVLVQGRVYDVTTYLVEHPGGSDVLVRSAGEDASAGFEQAGHSDYAVSLRDARLVGCIEQAPAPAGYSARVQAIKAQSKKVNPKLKLVQAHSRAEDCWILIDDMVVNATNYLQEHPGGAQNILNFAGKDATQAYRDIGHGPAADRIVKSLQVTPRASGSSLLPLGLGVLVLLLAVLWLFIS